MNKVNERYNDLKKRYKKSTRIFTIINIAIYIISAIIIVLNIFAIRKNPSKEVLTLWIFVSVTILVSVSAFVSSIISLYVFRKRNKEIAEKIYKINYEKEQYKNKTGDYTSTNPDMVLIDNVTKILNN